MILTCIQDNIYLSWQAELLALNCRELGQELTILIGWRCRPSDYALRLQRDFGAILIEDTRSDLSYVPSLRPHQLAKFVNSGNYLGEPVLLIDSDLLFKTLVFLPHLSKLVPGNSNSVYLSDCSSYLNADYLNGTDPDIMGHLCRIAEIDPGYVAAHPAAGGAQLFLPHLFDANFWQRVERVSSSMYRLMKNWRCSTYPVQGWTADMWAILYELYRREIAGECDVKISALLKFCFATDPVHYWQENNILHMAGVTAGMPGHFFKGNYTAQPPWECDLSHVQPENCSYLYVEAINRLKGKKRD